MQGLELPPGLGVEYDSGGEIGEILLHKKGTKFTNGSNQEFVYITCHNYLNSYQTYKSTIGPLKNKLCELSPPGQDSGITQPKDKLYLSINLGHSQALGGCPNSFLGLSLNDDRTIQFLGCVH